MQNVAYQTNLHLDIVSPDARHFSAQIDAGHTIVFILLSGYTGKVAVQLWDGNLAAGNEDAACRLVFHHPGALRDLILHRDLERLTEFYLAGQIDVVGDMEDLFTLAPHLSALKLSWRNRWQLVSQAMRRHYALTLRHWVKALVAKKQQAASLAGEESYRLWKLYMAGCAYFFDAGEINVYQVLVGHAGQPLDTPLTRDDLYRTAASA